MKPFKDPTYYCTIKSAVSTIERADSREPNKAMLPGKFRSISISTRTDGVDGSLYGLR